jgi:hypothetical protein
MSKDTQMTYNHNSNNNVTQNTSQATSKTKEMAEDFLCKIVEKSPLYK